MQFKFDFVAEWNAVIADERNFRFELAGHLLGVSIHGDERKTTFLVKAKCVKVIVSSNDPHPNASF